MHGVDLEPRIFLSLVTLELWLPDDNNFVVFLLQQKTNWLFFKEIVQGRKLFKGGNYMRKYGMQNAKKTTNVQSITVTTNSFTDEVVLKNNEIYIKLLNLFQLSRIYNLHIISKEYIAKQSILGKIWSTFLVVEPPSHYLVFT